MSDLGRRPETTCAFRRKRARKAHRCRDCSCEIKRGALYVQDDYYAPFGDGARYCLACAQDRENAERDWLIAYDRGRVRALEEEE